MTAGEPSARAVAPALAVAVAAISFAAIFFRQAQPTPALVSAGLRLAVAALVLAPLTIRSIASGKMRGRALRHAVAAGVCYGVHFGAWVASLERTTIAASVTLVTITPLLLAVLGAVTGRDRPDRRLWLLLGLATVGLALIGGADWRASADALAGDGLAVLGACAMAAYLLVGRRLGASSTSWRIRAWRPASARRSCWGRPASRGLPSSPRPVERFSISFSPRSYRSSSATTS
ncbi:MAG: DMT family transporter [Deltaproteobacteria bacterium]|nr:DMT family transporter [Deltaproteobacteria bacterium]